MSLRAAPQAASTSPATSSTSPTAAYSVHESRDADGITVREYVLPNNVVFAVSWQGPVRPDMGALLGSYFPNFVTAGEERLRGTGTLIQRIGGTSGQFLRHGLPPRPHASQSPREQSAVTQRRFSGTQSQ
jgi:hypothetical protein